MLKNKTLETEITQQEELFQKTQSKKKVNDYAV